MSFTHESGERPFAGQVALVTGAARPRGIGRATALGLARGGADVGVIDIARPYDEAPAHGTASGDDLASLVDEIETLMGGPEGLAAYVAREIPLGRLQSAEEIADAICWLLSDSARGVTGEALNVSAGQTMV